MTPIASPPTAWPLAVACAAAAGCVTFSGFHAFQTADSLIPVMVSLYGWEPFYWGQDRLGMLLPALAAPARHPFHNLLAQTGLSVAGVLGGIAVLACYLHRGPGASVVAAGGVAYFLVAFPPFDRFNVLNGCQPYLLPLGLALAAIRLAARPSPGSGWRVTAAGAMTSAAYWYNSGLGLTVAPLALGRAVFGRWLDPPNAKAPRADLREVLAAVVLTGFGTACGYLLMTLAPEHRTPQAFTAPAEWPTGWRIMAGQIPDRCGGFLVVSLIAVGLAAGWLWPPATRPAAGRAWLVVALVVAWLGSQIGVMGTLAWVRDNEYNVRYLFPGLVGLCPAVAAVVLGPPLAAFPHLARRAGWIAAAAVPVAAVAGYGWPSVGAARAGLAFSTGRWTDDLLAANCTHVVGEYWLAWPAAFHANLTLADRGDPRVLWAVTDRSKPTAAKWSAVPLAETRLGWVTWADEPPEPSWAYTWRWAFPETTCVERRPTLHVHVPIPPR